MYAFILSALNCGCVATSHFSSCLAFPSVMDSNLKWGADEYLLPEVTFNWDIFIIATEMEPRYDIPKYLAGDLRGLCEG